jgi:hypothetical protein
MDYSPSIESYSDKAGKAFRPKSATNISKWMSGVLKKPLHPKYSTALS